MRKAVQNDYDSLGSVADGYTDYEVTRKIDSVTRSTLARPNPLSIIHIQLGQYLFGVLTVAGFISGMMILWWWLERPKILT